MNASVKQVALVVALSFASFTASAWDVTAKVIDIEPSYMPDNIMFLLEVPVGTCPDMIQYLGNTYGVTDPKKNVQAVYGVLLLALATGKQVKVHSVTHCIATNVHIINN